MTASKIGLFRMALSKYNAGTPACPDPATAKTGTAGSQKEK